MKYYCTYCEYGTDNKFDFNKHKKTGKHILAAGENDTDNYLCYPCDTERDTEKDTEPIVEEEKITGKGYYICVNCNYSTTRKGNWKKHLNSNKHNKGYIANNDVSGKYYCSFCKYETNDIEILNNHKETEGHISMVQKLKNIKNADKYCDVCDIILNSKQQLKRHKETNKHTNNLTASINPEKRGSVCKVCNLTFKNYRTLNCHYKTKRHIKNQQYHKATGLLNPNVEISDEDRIPVKNLKTGERRYGINAPIRKNVDEWLMDNSDWEIIENYQKRQGKLDIALDKLEEAMKLIRQVLS